jgi:hypothetical protein
VFLWWCWFSRVEWFVLLPVGQVSARHCRFVVEPWSRAIGGVKNGIRRVQCCEDVASVLPCYRIDFLSRVELELGNDEGEMRPPGQKSWLTPMRANQERGLHECILITFMSQTCHAANTDIDQVIRLGFWSAK